MDVFNDTLWNIRRKEEGMAARSNYARKADTTQYSKQHIKAIVKSLGLQFAGETDIEISFYCPFHSNRHSASCSISKTTGAWLCFNPSCGETGSIIELVKKVLHKNDFEAMRYVYSKEAETLENFDDLLNDALEEKPEFEEFPQEILDRLHADLAGNLSAREYFKSRGINEESINYFGLGYSSPTNMVSVPVHSPDGLPVGLVGRSISEKKFKNSTNLPRSKTMFNIHRAKKIGDNVIIVESSFDAIRVHQAGFPNVIATLGGHISTENVSLINRYFNKVTLMTDSDHAGRELASSISSRLKNKDLLWASYEYGKIYPHDAKDAGDMTEEEIKACIKNAVSNIEYQSWTHEK
jgi:DNA primase